MRLASELTRSSTASWIFAALLAICAPMAAYAADPVEDLLRGNPSSAVADDSATPLVEPETAVQSATIPALAPRDAAADWAAAPHQSLQLSRDSDADHKSAPSPVNAVPEPSALLLALAALVYFMLFGRRRRMT